MTIENMEGAIAMLEAYIAGGDELGIVPEDDACEALNFIRGAVEWMGDMNQAQLATMTAERNKWCELAEQRLHECEMWEEQFDEVCVERDTITAEHDALKAQLDAVTAERDAAIRDKAYLSTAILQELPQELYLKVFNRYHKERGTYSQAQPNYAPEPKDRNLAEAWAERDGDI